MAYSNPSKVISGLTSFQQCMYVQVSDFNCVLFCSPAEPQEIPPGSDDAVVPHIPLIPIEDEEETMEDDHNSKGRSIWTS